MNIIYNEHEGCLTVSVYSEIYWVCRMYRNTISFPIDGYLGEKSIEIKSNDDIFKYHNLFRDALRCAKTAYNNHNNS